ncbi:MAG: hypothetical protein JXR81_01365 [Candidatus Goldbacteria bacterium]|nr:hypothetical protein [Candidatus Goldiibacteriota bacterium]
MAVKERLSGTEKQDVVSIKIPHSININVRSICEEKGLKMNRFIADAIESAVKRVREEDAVLDYYRHQKEKETALSFMEAAEKYGLKDKFFANGKQRKGKV